MGKKFLERDLFQPVCDFLRPLGYDIRSENNFCDITALRDEELVIIELKRTLNLDLIVQAVKRQKVADLVYIAVPKPSAKRFSYKWRDTVHLVRRLELGLLFVCDVQGIPTIEIAHHPGPFDRMKSKRMNLKVRTKIILEFRQRYADYNIGGSTGKKIMTAYRQHAIYIATCLSIYGPLSPKKLRLYGADPRKTTSILSKNHYHWFVRVKNGIYDLSEEGTHNLAQYKDLYALFKEKIVACSMK